jgi:hypothetical protein
MNTGKEPFQCGMANAECGIQNAERNAPVIAPVFTALRRGELLRRGKECGVRPNLISVIAQHRAPRHAPRCLCGIRSAAVPAAAREQSSPHPKNPTLSGLAKLLRVRTPALRDRQTPIAPIVHPKMNMEKSVQERNAPVFAPVITALRRGELLRRGKECGVRPHLISVIAQPRAPRPVK